MDLSIIISVSGRPGLYKVVGRSKSSLVVESLIDKKRIPVLSTDKVSALSDISIFTYEGDLPLQEVLLSVHDHLKGENAPAGKGNDAALVKLMRAAVPEYDEDRVYTSDMRKLFAWYNMLNEQGLINKDEAETEVETAEAVEVKSEKKVTKKVSKKESEKESE
jgi:hypothetical protein